VGQTPGFRAGDDKIQNLFFKNWNNGVRFGP
jgi:hypothetical protein